MDNFRYVPEVARVHTAIDELLASAHDLRTSSHLQSANLFAAGPSCALAAMQEMELLMDRMRDGITELSCARAQATKARNEDIPINRLPSEILCMIFMHLVETDGTLSAFTLSQTCTRWRSVALENLCIWAQIELSDLSLSEAPLVVERSYPHPLKVSANMGLTKAAVLDIVLERTIHRIKELSISQLSPNITYIMTRTPMDTCASLTRLSVDGYSKDPWSLVQPRNTPAPLYVDALFGGKTPALQHLSLRGIRMPFKSGSYHNLLSLRITHCLLDSLSVNDQDVLWAVSESPYLEYLELYLPTSMFLAQRAGHLAPEDGPRPTRTVLSRLRSVKLIVPQAIAYRMLSGIIAESIQKLQVEILSSRNAPEGHTTGPMIASLLRPHTISSQLIDGLTDIVVGINDRNTNGVTTFISDTRRGDSRMLRLVWPRDIRALPEVVDTLCTRYSLSSLHRLFLKAPETATPIATLMRLMSHPSLQVLDLESPSCASILSNLLDSASYNGPEMWPAVALVTIRGTQPGNIGWFLERWSHARPSMRVDLSGAVVQCMDEADARAFIRRLGQALDSRYPWPHFRYWESKGTDMGKLRAILLGHTTAAAPLNGPRGPL